MGSDPSPEFWHQTALYCTSGEFKDGHLVPEASLHRGKETREAMKPACSLLVGLVAQGSSVCGFESLSQGPGACQGILTGWRPQHRPLCSVLCTSAGHQTQIPLHNQIPLLCSKHFTDGTHSPQGASPWPSGEVSVWVCRFCTSSSQPGRSSSLTPWNLCCPGLPPAGTANPTMLVSHLCVLLDLGTHRSLPDCVCAAVPRKRQSRPEAQSCRGLERTMAEGTHSDRRKGDACLSHTHL